MAKKEQPKYKAILTKVWESTVVMWIARAITVLALAYTALDKATSLTASQQAQGAVALVAVAVVVSRAFKK